MSELNIKILEERKKKEILKEKEQKQLELEKEYLQAKQDQEEYAKKQQMRIESGEINDKVKTLIPEEKLKEYQDTFNKII